jgi:8-oxo-dGTP diphosphatase
VSDHPKPSLTADVCVFSRDPAGKLHALFIQRKKDPFRGAWALPGGFVEPGESAAVGAIRELAEETGLTGVNLLAQLGAFTEPGRDPRGWIVSVAFVAEIAWTETGRAKAGDDAADARWLEIREGDPPAALLDGGPVALAFDHALMLDVALQRLHDRSPRGAGRLTG